MRLMPSVLVERQEFECLIDGFYFLVINSREEDPFESLPNSDYFDLG